MSQNDEPATARTMPGLPEPSPFRIRVSRDSGRTWGPWETVRAGDERPATLLLTHAWPPCRCPRCATRPDR
ncbi:hypothetical protein ACWDR0_01415 [Streptomyces sp. NPDC003691]